MNPEIKAEWVAALRSGKYTQGKNVLRDEYDAFCCLGVLCDLHRRATNGGDWVDGVTTPSGDIECSAYEGATTYPPTVVAEWAGLDEIDNSNPAVRIDDKCMGVADFNDRGWSFAAIAEAIEANL